jgi:proteasome lid subunit RPN8/RPN11
MIVERGGREEAVRVTNLQNELHAKDPEQFPRTAAIAYTMGPEAAPILIGAERGELALRAFYHSHPDHDAYFSAEDRTQAMGGWDEPNYPQAAQIVISVRQRTVRATKVFIWDETARDFVEVSLVVRD